MLDIPVGVKKYLENENSVPLVEISGSRWYYISKAEKETLKQFVKDLDKIPESVWRTYPEDVILKYSFMGNLADRIVRNSIVREVAFDGEY